MKIGKLSKSIEDLNQQVLIQRITVLVLASLALVLSIMLATKHQTTILVPEHMDEKMEVSWNRANAAYFKTFAMQTAVMLGDMTPQNADFIIDWLGTMCNQQVYAKLKPQLLAYSQDPTFKRGSTFTYFSPTAVRYEDVVDKYYVTGYLNVASMAMGAGASTRVDAKQVTYEFKFAMSSGRPVITYLDNYSGDKAHTQEWLKQDQARSAAVNKAASAK